MHSVKQLASFSTSEQRIIALLATAKDLITNELSKGDMPEQELRAKALQEGHSHYAFYSALRELKDREVENYKAPGQGNRKILWLVSHP